jgi:osmotically-inducible protein OsmY
MVSPVRMQDAEFDRELSLRISRFLMARHVPAARLLKVDVQGGVVTLSGTVRSFYQKQLCINCCQRVAGVIRICDELEVAMPQVAVEALAV